MAQRPTKRLPTIGAVIRAWRLFRGLSSTELAEKAGVRLGYLSEIEHDRTTRPYEDYLEKLADALHVPLEDILGRRMPPKTRDRKKLKRATVSTPSPKQTAAPLPTIANPALAVTDSLFDTTWEQIEADIESRHLSKEQMERLAAGLIEANKLLLNLIKPEPEKLKED